MCGRLSVYVCGRLSVYVCGRLSVYVCGRLSVYVCGRLSVYMCGRLSVYIYQRQGVFFWHPNRQPLSCRDAIVKQSHRPVLYTITAPAIRPPFAVRLVSGRIELLQQQMHVLKMQLSHQKQSSSKQAAASAVRVMEVRQRQDVMEHKRREAELTRIAESIHSLRVVSALFTRQFTGPSISRFITAGRETDATVLSPVISPKLRVARFPSSL